ncbi:MAG: Holliday junction resolvase RuvX [Bacteroidota bacterium]
MKSIEYYNVMGRIMAIDYGIKRTGVAITDSLKLIATPLTTVNTPELLAFLHTYTKQEAIDILVVGMPKHLDNKPSAMTALVTKFIQTLKKTFSDQKIAIQDERYTSKIARASMLEGGFKKKDRRNKSNVDKLSATLILQSFLVKNLTHDRP